MTKTQAIIIKMINDGYRNTDIIQHTQKSPDYVSRVRRRLMEDPHYFETRTVINKIQNYKPRSADYSGRVECLRCERMFDSEDKRRNRICPKCSGERNNLHIVDSHMAQAHFSRAGRE